MRDESPVTLNRRAFDVLLYLVQHPGRAVTKEELLQSVWPETHVEENNLTQSISALRKALEEKPGANGFIATLPGRGYQFIAPVSRLGEPDELRELSAAPNLAGGSFFLQQRTMTTTVVTEERASRLRAGWITGGIAVVALLACAGGYAWKRRASSLQLHKVVVADFGNSTGDPGFDRALRRALEIDLEQSPYLDVMGETEGVHALKLMGREGDDAVTAEVAREVCVRTNRQVVLNGNIASLGKEYLVTVEATDCHSAAKLAGAKAQASTKEDVLRALDNVAERVRSKLGESATSVADFEMPIQQATTPSLEALKAYSMGLHLEAQGKMGPDAMSFFQRAVELDPNFAMAWGALANSYSNMSETAISSKYYRKAFALSSHLDALEKLTLEAHYYNGGLHDMQRAIQTFQLWAATYPRDWVPWQNLCNDYNELGLRQEAIAAGEQALRLDQTWGNIYNVLIRAYKIAGRYKDAQRLGEEAARRGLDHDAIHAFLLEVALDSHDPDVLARETKYGETRGDWFFFYVRAQTEAAVGKIRLANASFERSREIAQRENLGETADSILVDQAQVQYDLGMPSAARATMARIKQAYPDDPDLARLHAELGDVAYAEGFLVAQQANTADTLLNAVALPRLRAALALEQRKPMAAVPALDPARLYGRYDYPVLTERATAYMQAGKPDLAEKEYKAILASAPGTDVSSPLYNLAHLELARAYASEGKVVESREEYAEFLKLWAEA
jgi:DNA-binding winged helix-turn-helix (wHTH) protein/Flp pilus assembly protein TadD